MDNGSSEDVRAQINRTRSLADSTSEIAEATRKLARQTIANLAKFRADVERAKESGLNGNEIAATEL